MGWDLRQAYWTFLLVQLHFVGAVVAPCCQQLLSLGSHRAAYWLDSMLHG